MYLNTLNTKKNIIYVYMFDFSKRVKKIWFLCQNFTSKSFVTK